MSFITVIVTIQKGQQTKGLKSKYCLETHASYTIWKKKGRITWYFKHSTKKNLEER